MFGNGEGGKKGHEGLYQQKMGPGRALLKVSARFVETYGPGEEWCTVEGGKKKPSYSGRAMSCGRRVC